MGATAFTDRASGKTADEAYRHAVDQALYWNGHGGYTGTIAEKDGFVIYDLPVLPPLDESYAALGRGWMSDPLQRYANALGSQPAYDTEDSVYPVIRQGARDRKFLVERLGERKFKEIADTYDEKWGPAVAIRLSDGEWGFMGYASR
jgi:hypothetical protein